MSYLPPVIVQVNDISFRFTPSMKKLEELTPLKGRMYCIKMLLTLHCRLLQNVAAIVVYFLAVYFLQFGI